MKKSKLSPFNTKIQLKQWLNYKPYEKSQGMYDAYYLRIANQVQEVLLEFKENDDIEIALFEDFEGFENDAISKVSCVIASFFEDFTNEIGIWNYFIAQNKQNIGKELPFYDLTEYSSEYLNVQDIAYLLWHFWEKENVENMVYNPFSFEPIAENILEVLEDNLEDAPVTNFYKDYFKVADSIGFFDLKVKLHWLALESYIALDAKIELSGAITVLLGEAYERNLNMDTDIVGKLIYSMQDDYLYNYPLCFGSITALDILTSLAQCSDKKRAEIATLRQTHHGYYFVESIDKEYFHLKHIGTKQSYSVLRMSGQKTDKNMPESPFVVNTKLAKWNEAWWISGSVIGTPIESKEKAVTELAHKIYPKFWMYPAKNQETILESQESQYKQFTSFFGDDFLVFENGEKMVEGLKAMNEKNGVFNDPVHYENMLKQLATPEEMIVLQFDRTAGIRFFNDVENIICFLRGDAVSEKEAGTATKDLITCHDIDTVQKLLAMYPNHPPLKLSFSEVDVEANLQYYSRFYHTEYHQPKYPNIIDTELLNKPL